MVDILIEFFSYFGVAEAILSDRGSSFESKMLHLLCSKFGIRKIKTSSFFPSADGVCERLHRWLGDALSTLPHRFTTTGMGSRAGPLLYITIRIT